MDKPATDTVTIEVDGRKLQARKGQMLIEATDAAGIYIPRFCYHDHLSIAANCRMCLVEVEKAPKPLPACATPVMDGMVVRTRSDKARDAQKGTMEFLLINHPLDCPICDQGGECELQDLAMGYGKDVSRYHEAKRIVKDKNIGPLIATEMTRCIHCTRCVRFGQEVAGVMEFGGVSRGEHMEIRTFLDRSVDSELSGNVIDLCPVGALTSKPYRYHARPWELIASASVSPHDCVGANVEVHSRRGQVQRVVPGANEAVNGPWIADRDRFSYEAVNGQDRLTRPMIKRGGKWEATDWNTALDAAANALRQAVDRHGAGQVGALIAPGATVEEQYLLAKLMRALGSGNIDHRLRQTDFSDDVHAPTCPSLGMTLPELETRQAVLLIGSNLRKEQPLLNLRVRRANRAGAPVMAINPVDYEFNYRLAAKRIVNPVEMLRDAARVAVAAAEKKSGALAAEIKALATGQPTDSERAMAEALAKAGSHGLILLGQFATAHPRAAALRSVARAIGAITGAHVANLPEANGVGAWLAGAVPHRGPIGAGVAAGRNAAAMLRDPLKAYLLFGVEPEHDGLDGALAVTALRAADSVVLCTAFMPAAGSRAADYADVLLPIAAYTENEGTVVNIAGRAQSFNAAVPPPGEARPGWKVLRVLGNRLRLSGFEQNTVDEARAELDLANARAGEWQGASFGGTLEIALTPDQLYRLAEVPMYAVDAFTRRAPALQATADNPPPAARLNGKNSSSRTTTACAC
jgi:NADH-quinone oxidoreductase subunit G